MDRHGAEMTVRALESNGEILWRIDGQVPGERQKFIDAELRERLVEVLSTYGDMEEDADTAKRNLREMISNLDEVDFDGLDVTSALTKLTRTTDPKEFPERAYDMIKALAERGQKLRENLDTALTDLEERRTGAVQAPTAAEPPKVKIVRSGARTARAKVGSTTHALPFAAASNDVEVRTPTGTT